MGIRFDAQGNRSIADTRKQRVRLVRLPAQPAAILSL